MSVFIDTGEPGTWARQLAYRSLPCQQQPSPRVATGLPGEIGAHRSPGTPMRAASTPRSSSEVAPLTASLGHHSR